KASRVRDFIEACAQRTLKRFLSPAHHWPPNDIWTFHIQRGHRRLPHHQQTLSIAGATFGEIKNLADYVKHGQATHAEMMRAEFESARRDRPNNGGTMVWMLNDCWPTSNWSIIDYDRLPKPAYYAARRACAPLLPIIFERAGKIEFFVGNDTLAPARVRLIYGQESLDGQQAWTERGRFTVAPNSTHRFASLDRSSLNLPPGDFLFIETCVGAATLDKIAWFPDGWRHIPWPTPTIKVEETRREKSDGRHLLYLRVTTGLFARFCHLRLKDFDPGVLFSDNFFDLCAGQSKIVIVDSRRKLTVKDFVVGHWATEWE
ncbi:MAG TPA: hypothetical protein P5137_09410, partial [Candidatus Brocadiia bacterium]|nr:hypothetical protein [Candidatus Brocadiia bacterium]